MSVVLLGYVKSDGRKSGLECESRNGQKSWKDARAGLETG